MHKYQHDAHRHDITDTEHIDHEERLRSCCFPIGKLLTHQGLRGEPPHKDTREQGASRQHILCRQIVAELHQGHAQQLDVRLAYRQRAENGNQAAHSRLNPSRCRTSYLQFFVEESRADLMHGDGRGQSSEYQQGIEQDTGHIAHPRYWGKSLMEHIRQRDEDERRTTVGIHSYREGIL